MASAELVLRDRPTPPCAAVTLAAHRPPRRQPRVVPAGHTSHNRPLDTSLPRGSGSKSGSPQSQGGGLCWAGVLGAQSHSQWAALRLVPISHEAGGDLGPPSWGSEPRAKERGGVHPSGLSGLGSQACGEGAGPGACSQYEGLPLCHRGALAPQQPFQGGEGMEATLSVLHRWCWVFGRRDVMGGGEEGDPAPGAQWARLGRFWSGPPLL